MNIERRTLNKTQHRTLNVEPKTSIIIPAYKEEEGLPIILEKLFRVINENPKTEPGTLNVEHRTYEVIVVDDGSTDRTSEVALRFSVRLIKHEKNLGKGEALKTGIKNARGENIIWIDADNTYPVEVIPQMADSLKTYDMVVGSRRYGRENIPRFNRFGNFFLRNMIKGIYGFKPFDPLTGLWGVKKNYAEKILPTVRFAPDAEMGIKAARMKLRMQDIPITYGSRLGNSKLKAIRGGYEHLKLILTLLRWHPKD